METVISSKEDPKGAKGDEYRHVSEHVLTPVPSAVIEPSGINKTDKEFVEKLLFKLLDDLNHGRLNKNDLVKLTSHCLQMISNMDEEHSSFAMSEGDMYDSAVADDLVRFTLSKVLDDIRSGSISNDDLTDLTLSVLGVGDSFPSQDTMSSNDEEVQMYIDETIQRILSRDTLDKESPVDDGMLDEFIVQTLRDIASDVEQGNLNGSLINEMLNRMNDEFQSLPYAKDASDSLQQLLSNLIEELSTEKSDTLYKVINIIVNTYHRYRESSSKCIAELITSVVEKVSTSVTKGELDQSEIDIETLCGVAIKINDSSFSTTQLNKFTSDLVHALHMPAEGQDPNHLQINAVMQDARARVYRADMDELKELASVVTTNYGDIKEKPIDDEKEEFLEDVSSFVVDILKLVWKSIDQGRFSNEDIDEMAQLCLSRASSRPSPQKSPSIAQRKANLSDTIISILDDVEQGNIAEEEILELSEKLQECGKKLLAACPNAPCQVSSGPSFTSTAIADDVVSHVLSSIQTDFEEKKESLKELAICVLKTTMSNISDQNIDDFECLYPSPCDSKLAEDIVNSTIEDIRKELNEETLSRGLISSIAESAIDMSSLGINNDDKARIEHTMTNVIDCLRKDKLNKIEAQKMFAAIISAYKQEWKQELFSRGLPASSDSELAESLIRETLSKIERDIKSGCYSNDDLITIVGSSFEDQMEESKEPNMQDMANLSIAIIQELMIDLQTGAIPKENVTKFVSIFSTEEFTDSNETITGKLRKISIDLRTHGPKSKYFQQIMHALKHNTKFEDNTLSLLQKVLDVVQTDVLSNFVRMTLQGILSTKQIDLTAQEQNVKNATAPPRSDIHIQSITSILADNIVKNLLVKIQNTVTVHGELNSDEELVPIVLDQEKISQDLADNINQTNDGLLSNISDMVLETLNNIVSNMRLEGSTSPRSKLSELGMATLSNRVSSHMVHDFVLQQLQCIVESMQDGLTLNKASQFAFGTVENTESLLEMNDDEAMAYVMDTLKDVVQELAMEVEQENQQADKHTSTSSLEAEAIVLHTLQSLMDEFVESDKIEIKKKGEIAKQQVIKALCDIKTTLGTSTESEITEAFAEVILSSRSSTFACEEDTPMSIVTSAIDILIDNLEQESVKADFRCKRDIYRASHEIIKIMNSEDKKESKENDLPRPSASLAKMADLTGRMIKMHEEMLANKTIGNRPSSAEIDTYGIDKVVTETLDKTINNVKKGSLTDKELVDLASALSNGSLEEEARLKLSTTSVDASIEEFIVDMLETVKQNISTTGLTTEERMNATDRILEMNVSEENRARSADSLSSVSSEILAGYVNDVLLKLAKSLENVQISTTDIKESPSTDSQGSKTSITTKNVNPNAQIVQTSSTSLSVQTGPHTEMSSLPKYMSSGNLQSDTLYQKRTQENVKNSKVQNAKSTDKQDTLNTSKTREEKNIKQCKQPKVGKLAPNIKESPKKDNTPKEKSVNVRSTKHMENKDKAISEKKVTKINNNEVKKTATRNTSVTENSPNLPSNKTMKKWLEPKIKTQRDITPKSSKHSLNKRPDDLKEKTGKSPLITSPSPSAPAVRKTKQMSKPTLREGKKASNSSMMSEISTNLSDDKLSNFRKSPEVVEPNTTGCISSICGSHRAKIQIREIRQPDD